MTGTVSRGIKQQRNSSTTNTMERGMTTAVSGVVKATHCELPSALDLSAKQRHDILKLNILRNKLESDHTLHNIQYDTIKS